MNNMEYSTTQATNLVTIVGLIGLVLAHFHINITNEELQTATSAFIVLGGVVMNWVHRYNKGGLTLGGLRI